MLGLLLVFLTSVTGQVTSCQLDASNSSCVAPAQQATCIEVCNKHHTNNSCSQNPACAWSNNICSNSNISSQCYNIQTSGVCATSPGCAWEVSPCKFGGECLSNNGSLACSDLTSSSTCVAQGCEWTPQCQPSNACDLLDDQASCTSSSGCFWYQVYVNDSYLSPGYTSSPCSPCFTDPYNNTDNFYATIAARVGQVCHTYPYDNFYLDATPAAAGCSGGVVYAPGRGLDNCSTYGPTAAPTTPNPSATAEPTAAPTAEPTAAPTAEPTAAPTAAPNTPAPTAAPNTPAPTAAPNTAAPTAAPNTAAPTAAPNTVAPTAAPTTEAPSIVNGAEQLFAPVALAFSLLFFF